MIEHYYAVIMAGGGGTRLWPLSRQKRPKQMLNLTSQRTMYQMAVDRLDGLFPPQRILVVTVAEQAEQLKAQCPQIPDENFLIEPMPRGTASVVGYAAVALQARDEDAVMAVLTADHYIANIERFHRLLCSAEQVSRQGYLVTLGIKPTYPSTGYGYVQRGKQLGIFGDNPAYEVIRFKEKPDLETAERFLRQGDHDWNSGMFIWRVKRILEEFHLQMPDLAQKLDKIAADWNTPERWETIKTLWQQITPQTIDYGIMEHSKMVAVLPAEGLIWNDVGSWESFFEIVPPDDDGNIVLAKEYIGMDVAGSLLHAEASGKLIALLGVNDLIIVDTEDVLFICPRKDAQKVRELVARLKDYGLNNYL